MIPYAVSMIQEAKKPALILGGQGAASTGTGRGGANQSEDRMRPFDDHLSLPIMMQALDCPS